jgi:hypothetical protein
MRMTSDPLVIVMDASAVGRGCLAWVVSVLFKKRALPIGWLVVKGGKGHLCQEKHTQLLGQVALLVPQGRRVVFLGDGEFDGCGLLAALRQCGWDFVCRTAKNIQLEEVAFPGSFFWFADLCVGPGEFIEVSDALFTGQGFGPLLAVAVWETSHKEPLYLVSSLELGQEALFWYKKRFVIETLFSDQKSRGFFVHKSHLTDPARLARLLIATCLAYIWLVLLGAQVKRNRPWRKRVHRGSRCDLSLFQLGRTWLEECLNEGWRIPVLFQRSKL